MRKSDSDKVSYSFTHLASKYDLTKEKITKKDQAPASLILDINGKPINSKDFNAKSSNSYLKEQDALKENKSITTIKEGAPSSILEKYLEQAKIIAKKREAIIATQQEDSKIKSVEISTPAPAVTLSMPTPIESVTAVQPKEQKVQLLNLTELIAHTPVKKQDTKTIEPIGLVNLKVPEVLVEDTLSDNNHTANISTSIPSAINDPSMRASIKNTLQKANESLMNSLNPDLIFQQLNIPKLKSTFKIFLAEQKKGFTKMVTPYQVKENPVALKEFIEHTKKLIEADKQMKPVAYRGAEQVTNEHILKIIHNKDTGLVDLRNIPNDYEAFKDIQDIPMNEIERINEKEGIFACNAFGVAIVTTNLDNKRLNLKIVKDVWDRGQYEEVFKVIGPDGKILSTSTGKKNDLTITEALIVQAKNTRELWIAAGGGR